MILKTPNITTDGRLVMLSLDDGLTRTINIYGVQEIQGKLLWSFARSTGKSPTKEWLKSEDGDEFKADVDKMLWMLFNSGTPPDDEDDDEDEDEDIYRDLFDPN